MTQYECQKHRSQRHYANDHLVPLFCSHYKILYELYRRMERKKNGIYSNVSFLSSSYFLFTESQKPDYDHKSGNLNFLYFFLNYFFILLFLLYFHLFLSFFLLLFLFCFLFYAFIFSGDDEVSISLRP